MSITAEDLTRIVTDVWRDVLTHDAAPAAAADPTALTGCIQVTGAFRGAIVLAVPAGVATAAAATMFAMPAGDVGAEERRDAVGELTNMVGGHVKSMVASPSQLALPAVIPGAEHGLDPSRLQLLAEQAMQVDGGTIGVRVYEDVG